MAGAALGILLLALWILPTAPGLVAHLAAFDSGYARIREWSAKLGWTRERGRWSAALEALGGFLATFAFPAGVILFFVGSGDDRLAAAPLLLGPVGWLLGVRGRAAAQRIAAARIGQPSFADRVHIKCPACGGRLRIARLAAGLLDCPLCSAKSAIRVPKAHAPALAAGAAVVGLWLAAVRPWQAGASPIAVAAWSAICLVLCVVAAPILEARRREREQTSIARGALEDLRLAFVAMIVTALVFAAVDIVLPHLSSLQLQGTTVRQFLSLQRWLHGVQARLGTMRLGFWTSSAAFFGAALLLGLGHLALAGAVHAAQRWISKVLKVISVAALCVSAFSLAGVAGLNGLDRTLSTTFQLDTLSEPGLARGVDNLARRIAQEAVRRSLEAQDAAKPACHGEAAAPCPGPLIASFKAEGGLAKTYADEWPQGVAASRSPSADLGAQADAWAAEAEAAQRARPTPDAATTGAADPYLDLPSKGAANFLHATDAPIAPLPDEDGLSARRREVAGLGVGIALDLLPLDAGDAAKGFLGDFPAELVSSVGDAVKAPFKAAVQAAARRAMAACARAGDCKKASDDEVARAQADPRVRALAAALSTPLVRAAGRWTGLEDQLRLANAAAHAELDRLAVSGLRAEREGEWGQVRAGMEGPQAFAGVGEGQGVREVRRDWRVAAYRMAVNDARGPTPAPGVWDRRFADFLLSHPRAAAVFGYVLLRDPQATAVLRAHLGLGQTPEGMDYLDAFGDYLAAVGHDPTPAGLAADLDREHPGPWSRAFVRAFMEASLPQTRKRETDLAAEAQIREHDRRWDAFFKSRAEPDRDHVK